MRTVQTAQLQQLCVLPFLVRPSLANISRFPKRHALASCGWVGKFDLSTILEECEANGEFERAAALAVWHGDIGAAVNALQQASIVIRQQQDSANDNRTAVQSGSYAETLDLVAMCIAGFGMSSSSPRVWETACSTLLQRDDLSESHAKASQTAYLRVLCQFLLNTGQEDCTSKVLFNSDLSLCDRVAFACRFLDSKELRELTLL